MAAQEAAQMRKVAKRRFESPKIPRIRDYSGHLLFPNGPRSDTTQVPKGNGIRAALRPKYLPVYVIVLKGSCVTQSCIRILPWYERPCMGSTPSVFN